jgi:thiol-disulfide isomerase/thioredoxin
MGAGIGALALRRDLTTEDWDHWFEPDCEIPLFCLVWSSRCHPCKELHSKWTHLQEEYANDKDILIGALNCVESRICDREDIPTIPAFIEHFKGDYTNSTEENKTMEVFQYIADSLIEKASGPRLIKSRRRISSFPSFVLRTKPGIDYSILHILKRVISRSEIPVPFYLDERKSNPDGPKLVAHRGPNQRVEYEGELSFEGIEDFVLRNVNIFDFDWSIKAISKSRHAVLVTNDTKGMFVIQKLATKLPGRYVWGRARPTPDLERQFSIDDRDLPSLLVVEGGSRGFAVLRSVVESRDMERFLRDPGELSPIPGYSLAVWISIAGAVLGVLISLGIFYWAVFGRKPAKKD